jgi:DNA repair protein RadC
MEFNPSAFELVSTTGAPIEPVKVSSTPAVPASPKGFKVPVYRVSVVRDRSIDTETVTVSSVQSITEVLKGELLHADRERLLCLMLNCRHKIIGLEVISIGTLTASLAHPREIFKGAIIKGAAGIILAHNHPSGDPSPSEEDIRLTKRVSQAGQLLGVDVLDHIIIAETGHYSFKTSGVL